MYKNIANAAAFEKEYIEPVLFVFLDELETDFYKNLEQYKALFIRDFIACCNEIIALQKTRDFKVGYILFNLLRQNVLDKNYNYPLFIYNKDWYLHKSYMTGCIHFQYIYGYYERFFETIHKLNKQIAAKVPAPDLEFLALRYLEYFHAYVVALARYSIFDAAGSDEFYAVKKEASIQIQTGEYFEPCDFIYKETMEKEYTKLKYLIKNHKEASCCCEDFRGIDITNLDASGALYCNADFRNSKLVSTDFYCSDLRGGNFSSANMENSSFQIALISGACFENANLQGADFRRSLSGIGNKFAGERQKKIYTGVSFRNSSLIKANFDNAVLKAADFLGADLSLASFVNAALYRCKFSKKQANDLGLSIEQKDQIIIL